MDFETVIRERKSTRLFSSKEVEKEKLDKVLEAGRIAPTAKNSQAFRIFVVNSKEGLDKIDKCSPCRYKAPLVLIVCGSKEKAFKEKYAIDPSIVATHMMLEATNVGLDNIWIGMFDEDKIVEEFDIPEEWIPVMLMPLGYKAKLCPPSPMHKMRKKIEELVEYR